MPTTDPIADFLNRVRNGMRVRKPYVDVPYSRMKAELARVLFEASYIYDHVYVDEGPQGFLRLYLKYTARGDSAIQGLRRISKCGLRRYVDHTKIPRVLNGLGMSIVTTSRGVMTGGQAKKLGLGGELIAEIW
ncbi:30S ribosomal protein S8 [candidate division KSB1 bacterium]|nr:30S ribosomal protein S8 [candidate division KSB1 bacterium]